MLGEGHPSPGNFNPRPREGGRRSWVIPEFQQLVISIHAPARGGDLQGRTGSKGYQISIHAPARGGDLRALRLGVAVIAISIHAPARGGDALASTSRLPISNFNPRPREGGRPGVISFTFRAS